MDTKIEEITRIWNLVRLERKGTIYAESRIHRAVHGFN